MNKFSKYFEPFLIRVIALGLAVTAAYFSITGLAKLFSGTHTAVLIMASMLEAAKVISASWLHKNWIDKEISRFTKWLLTSFVVILMCITSAGIYGFLSSGYFDTSNKLTKIDSEIGLIDKKKIIFENKIQSYSQLKDTKTSRIGKLTDLRTQQESRIDSLYKKGMIQAAKRTESQIKEANEEINTLMKEVDEIDLNIQVQNDSIAKIDIKKVDLSNSDIASEIGPLKYIAKLTGKSMDSVINWFILALIFVFDPLAILLMTVANTAFEKARKKKEEKPEEKNEVKQEVVPTSSIEPEEQKEVETSESEVTEEETVSNDVVKEFFETKQETEKEFKKKVEELNNAKKGPESEVLITPSISEETETVSNVEEQPSILEEVVEKQEVEEDNNPSEIEETEEDDLEEQEKETLYLKLLSILFKDGELTVGNEIFSYKEFLEEIKRQNVEYSEKLIRDFLTACNLLKVIDTSNNKRVILKDFKTAKEIIKII